MRRMKTVRGRASLTAAGSATLFAAVSGARHFLTKGLLSISLGTGTAICSIEETTSGGTSAAILAGDISASAPLALPIDFGPDGYMCSATGSRVILNLESSNSSVYCSMVGYTQ